MTHCVSVCVLAEQASHEMINILMRSKSFKSAATKAETGTQLRCQIIIVVFVYLPVEDANRLRTNPHTLSQGFVQLCPSTFSIMCL